MEVNKLAMLQADALEQYRAYQKDRHYSEPIDDEIRTAYKHLSNGKVVIRAVQSIIDAGLKPDGFPKLAICRADKKKCRLIRFHDGSCRMVPEGINNWRSNVASSLRFNFDASTGLNPTKTPRDGLAIVPLIPIHLRPRRALESYHLLWEAEWDDVPPIDPYLLRRIGKGDMWLVCAAWDLTEVERAALSTRMRS